MNTRIDVVSRVAYYVNKKVYLEMIMIIVQIVMNIILVQVAMAII